MHQQRQRWRRRCSRCRRRRPYFIGESQQPAWRRRQQMFCPSVRSRFFKETSLLINHKQKLVSTDASLNFKNRPYLWLSYFGALSQGCHSTSLDSTFVLRFHPTIAPSSGVATQKPSSVIAHLVSTFGNSTSDFIELITFPLCVSARRSSQTFSPWRNHPSTAAAAFSSAAPPYVGGGGCGLLWMESRERVRDLRAQRRQTTTTHHLY